VKAVISASKRTDIPAFYMRWLLDRLNDGFVDVPNPLYRNRVTRVSLRPEDVAWIVFWSKNYHVFERYAGEFASYELFFQFTINPPNAFLEPDVPSSSQALAQIAFLALRYGGSRVAWRYDPIVCWRQSGALHSNYDPLWFDMMCRELSSLGVARCHTSFADHYAKFRQRVRRAFPAVDLVDPPDTLKLSWAAELGAIARSHRMRLYSCAEPALDGVLPRGSCIDGRLLNALGGSRVSCARTGDSQSAGREACACTRAIDIGDYQVHECGYSCLYCYANPNHKRFDVPTHASKTDG